MGQIVEASSFDTNVYQWETTDSVTGGTNGTAVVPIRQLTNRTRYLLDKTAALQQQIAPLAPVDSPTFTGTPQAPTQALSASGNEIVTAAMARAFASGVIQISMSGTYPLSTIEAANAVIIAIGSPPAGSLLLLPANALGRWTVYNSTSAKIVVRLAQGGQAIAIATGCGQTFFSNYADLFLTNSDFTDTNLQGAPITPAPPLTDNSSRLVNTAWANNRIANEANLRAQADNQIRADVAAGYALQQSLNSEANTRYVQDVAEAALRASADNQIRADVEGTYLRKGQVQGGSAHGNFTPGDGFDVPIAVSFTTGATGGVVFLTASLIASYQVPNAMTLDVYFSTGAHTNSETTFGTMAVQTAQGVPANTAISISAHCRTGYGGGWCQMALALAYIFVPNA